MYIRRLFIILFLFTLNISAQIAFPDRVKTNKQKLIYLNQKALKSQNNDSTLSYYNQAIRFSKQNTCDSVSLSSYYGKSLTTYHLGKYDTFLLSIKTLERLNSNCNSLYFSYKTHLLYVDYYGIISEPDKAIEHNKKAIEIAKNLGTLELADAYYSLGYTYFLSNLNKQAKTYFLLALQYYDKANVDEKVKYRTYSGLINVCEDKEEIDRYLNKTLRLIEAYKNPYYIAYFYMQKGDAYFKINAPYNETKAVLLKAISYSEHIDDNNQIKSVNLYNLARLENKEKNYTRSTKIFEDLLKDTVYATVTK